MREIKFRVWHKPSKTMFEWEKVKVNPFKIIDDDQLVVMQYTGLKDKNGWEIYEGDIVKVAWRYDSDIGTVKYIRNGFFMSDMKRHTSIPLGSISATYEIIGHKYTSPELLGDPQWK